MIFLSNNMRLKNILRCLRRQDEPAMQMDNIEKKEMELAGEEFANERGSQWLQFAAAISACLALIGCGGHLGWTSPALPYLSSEQLSHPITKGEGSWITSLYTIGGIVGSLITPLLIDRLGRKLSLLTFAAPQAVGWGIIIAYRSAIMLYIARFVAGIGHGGLFNIATIYLAEIADKNVRGIIGTFLKMSVNIGSLFVVTLGAYLPYWQLNIYAIVVPLIFMVTFAFMPETPQFHLIKGRISDAEKSLMSLRSFKRPESVAEDLKAMNEAIEEGKRSKRHLFRELVSTRGNRRGLLILFGLKATQQFSGHMALVAYTQEIFTNSGSPIPPEQAVVVVGLFQVAAGFLAAGLVERLGRRFLLLVSGLSAAVALTAIGVFFYLKYHINADVSAFSWLPMVALIAYNVMEVLGIGTLPYVLLGELFPMNVKGTAVALGILVGSAFASIVGLGFQAMNTMIGAHWTFWIFAICCTSGTLFVYFITPETKGKTLEEIQRILNEPKVKQTGPLNT